MPENKSNSSNTSANINADTLEFVKNLWGGMQIPGFNQAPGMSMPTPTFSVQDLDKKIEDLKTVESWLHVNMSMLRGTIQTLEVQRATIATLQSMSATLASGAKQSDVDQQSASKQSQTKDKDQTDAYAQFAQSAAWWNVLQDQFKSVLNAVVPDVGENDAAKVTASEPNLKSGKDSVKTAAKATTKTTAKTAMRRTKSKKAN